MKKRKVSLFLVAVVVVCILSLFFCDKMAKKLQREIRLSDSELKEYTALAYDLSEVNVGNISKILIQGQKQKVSFVFPGDCKQQVTIDYSAEDYRINSNNVNYEQIDSAVIVLNRLINLQFDNIYRIEFDNARKLLSIQGDSASNVIFIVDFSDDKNIRKNLKPTKNANDNIYFWEKGIPMWIIFSFVIFILYQLEQSFTKKNSSKNR